jgi:hypothetical protein
MLLVDQEKACVVHPHILYSRSLELELLAGVRCMDITIELTFQAFDCLAEHMPRDSSIYTTCHNLRLIFTPDGQPRLELRCSEKEVEPLLGVGKQYCPDAFQQIEEAMRKAWQN